jgi:dihydrofolate reductase
MTSTIVAVEHLSLDGVFQAPARADEDPRNGFKHGGWSAAGGSAPELQSAIGRYMGGGWSLLAGRTTYEDLYEGWHVRQPDSAMTKALASAQKFVVTRNASYTPAWENSTLLPGEAIDTVKRLKAEHETTFVIFGSGELVRALLGAQLLNELLLMIHPIALGEGARLLVESDVAFQLEEATPASTGVLITRYRPV